MKIKLRFELISLFLLVFTKPLRCWIFGSSDESSAKTPVALDAKGEAGRFELKTSDDKFLAQAQTYLQLSPLDQCNYRVINHIKRSCSDMPEEELNKMAVYLLNCQLFIENRPTFECEESMSIGECTSKMDATEWNAYQIVANRARAVCYHTRQQIFRIKTEAAVNRLVQTSHEQISGMEKLREDQERLGQVTSETLHKVDATQHEMMLRHEKMKSSQLEMEQHIVKNLKSLTREKALIAAGQKEIAEMTEGLKARLELTADAMAQQGEVQGETHDEIIRDLATIREQAQEVMEKMTGNAETMAAYQTRTHEHYEETLSSLRQVNASVNFVISTVNALQDGVYAKLGWLEIALGGTGDKVAFLKTVCSHILYLLLAVLSAIFLRTPPFTRLFLILLIPLNALAEIRGKSSLDFTLMTLFILLSATANVTLNVALGFLASISSFVCAPRGKTCNGSSSDVATKTTSDAATASTALATRSNKDELVEASEFGRVGRKSTRKSDSSSRSRKRGSKSRSRSRSRSRGRVRRISSSDSEGEKSSVPSSLKEETLEDSGIPSRLSSTLISNSAHLTAKFGETIVIENREKPLLNGLPSLGSLVPRSSPPSGFPDRSYSESALSALRLVSHGSAKSQTGSRPSPTAAASPTRGKRRPILSDVPSNTLFLKDTFVVNAESFKESVDVRTTPGDVRTSSPLTSNVRASSPLTSNVRATSPLTSNVDNATRSRRRSSSRGRTMKDELTGSRSDKENRSSPKPDQSLRSQSLITNHFVDGRPSRRSKTPPRLLSATFDTALTVNKSTPRGQTPPRSKSPSRLINVTRIPCAAMTKNGTMCKNSAMDGKDFCGQHGKLG